MSLNSLHPILKIVKQAMLTTFILLKKSICFCFVLFFVLQVSLMVTDFRNISIGESIKSKNSDSTNHFLKLYKLVLISIMI